MAGAGTKRIVDLTEAPEVQSGDYIAIDSTARGTKKTPVSVFAKAADLTAEQTARQQADEAEAQARTQAISAEQTAREQAIEAEQTAREEADDALTESVTALSDEVTAQGALIQNPTKTVSGSIAHFTDGAEMPATSVIVNIEPVQSGTGTPSPDNVRQISGWESVSVTVSPTQDAQDGTTTPVNLGRTVYGGTLDVVSGVLTVDRAMVDLGTLDWTYSATDRTFWTSLSSAKRPCTLVCSNYPQDHASMVQAIADKTIWNERYAYISTNIVIKDTTYTSVADFKTAMSGVQLVYELATPQTYTLTPTEVSTLLGENNVWADAGAVEVTYRRDINLALEQLEALLNS